MANLDIAIIDELDNKMRSYVEEYNLIYYQVVSKLLKKVLKKIYLDKKFIQ